MTPRRSTRWHRRTSRRSWCGSARRSRVTRPDASSRAKGASSRSPTVGSMAPSSTRATVGTPQSSVRSCANYSDRHRHPHRCTAPRSLPAVRRALVVCIGLVLVAGCDAPTRPEHTTRIAKLDNVSSSIDLNGDVGMATTVYFPSEEGGAIRLGTPTLGAVSDVQLDGSPRTASGENVDLDLEGDAVAMTWVVHGAVERHADAAIVTIPLWTPPRGASGDDTRVPISGVVQLPAAPIGQVRWHGASPAVMSIDGPMLRFNGEVGTNTPSAL